MTEPPAVFGQPRNDTPTTPPAVTELGRKVLAIGEGRPACMFPPNNGWRTRAVKEHRASQSGWHQLLLRGSSAAG